MWCGGWIYAAREEGTPLVKIGCTTDLKQRLGHLRWEYHANMALLASVAVPCCALGIERRIHQRLASARIEGEWFYCHMSIARLEELALHARTALHGDPYGYHRAPKAIQRHLWFHPPGR